MTAYRPSAAASAATAATTPGLWLYELVTRRGWIDPASAQLLLVAGLGLFIPLRSGWPQVRDAAAAFVAAVLLAGGVARLSGLAVGGGLAWDPFTGMPVAMAIGVVALGQTCIAVTCLRSYPAVTSIRSLEPGAAQGVLREARARFFLSVGDHAPLVACPTCLPPES